MEIKRTLWKLTNDLNRFYKIENFYLLILRRGKVRERVARIRKRVKRGKNAVEKERK